MALYHIEKLLSNKKAAFGKTIEGNKKQNMIDSPPAAWYDKINILNAKEYYFA